MGVEDVREESLLGSPPPCTVGMLTWHGMDSHKVLEAINALRTMVQRKIP